MALDNLNASIPLQAGQPSGPFGPDIQKVMQMQALQQRMQQLQEIQRGENTLRSLYGNKDNVDPATNQLNPNALRQLYSVSPSAAQDYATQAAQLTEHKARGEALNSQAWERGRLAAHEIGVETLSDYRTNLPKVGAQRAMQMAQEKLTDLLAEAKSSNAMLPEQLAKFNPRFDPITFETNKTSFEAANTKPAAPITPFQQKELTGQEDTRAETAQHHRALEDAARAGGQTPQGQAFAAFKKEHPNATAEEQQSFIQQGKEPSGESLSDDAIKYWGRRVWLGDPIPPLYRDSASRKKIFEEVARLSGDKGGAAAGEDIARKSGVRSDSTSLTNITRIADSAEAYENTAIKNMDIVTQKMPKGVATNIGPILNRWLQTGRAEFGSADVPPYATALVTVANEYAKVMSGSTGAQGSTVDSRREAAELLNRAQTTDQVLAVMDVMKQDMENKKSSYRDQRKAIQDRIGGAGEPGSPLPTTGTPSGAAPSRPAGSGGVSTPSGIRIYQP